MFERTDIHINEYEILRNCQLDQNVSQQFKQELFTLESLTQSTLQGDNSHSKPQQNYQWSSGSPRKQVTTNIYPHTEVAV